MLTSAMQDSRSTIKHGHEGKPQYHKDNVCGRREILTLDSAGEEGESGTPEERAIRRDENHLKRTWLKQSAPTSARNSQLHRHGRNKDRRIETQFHQVLIEDTFHCSSLLIFVPTSPLMSNTTPFTKPTSIYSPTPSLPISHTRTA